MTKKRRLTPEQDEMRLRGLRILARMIVRVHLDSQGGEPVGKDGGGPDGPKDAGPGGLHLKDGEHVG